MNDESPREPQIITSLKRLQSAIQHEYDETQDRAEALLDRLQELADARVKADRLIEFLKGEIRIQENAIHMPPALTARQEYEAWVAAEQRSATESAVSNLPPTPGGVVIAPSNPTPEPEHALGAPTPDPAPAAVVAENQEAKADAEEMVAPDPEPPAPELFSGPFSDAQLADCLLRYDNGESVKEIADRFSFDLPRFANAFKDYRYNLKPVPKARAPEPQLETEPEPETEPESADARPALPPTPGAKVTKDPDQNRSASGWTVQEDIQLLEDLGVGMKASRVAELLERKNEEIIARFKFLCPAKTAEQQGVVLCALRKVRDGAAKGGLECPH